MVSCKWRKVLALALLAAFVVAQDHKANGDAEPRTEESNVARKLKQVFGDGCKEAMMSIQMHLPSRGFLLASDMFEPQPDGRIKLAPFSMAKFGKPAKDGDSQTIITIRSDYAYLTLDRRISSMLALGNCKILGIELADGIRLAIDGPAK
jgi:hypothetical protein